MRATASWQRSTLAACAWGLLLLLGGCGFHLQGHVELPRSLANARLEASDQQSDFYISLHRALYTAGARFDGPEASAAIVRILEDSSSERILTVSARNTPTAFLLSYHVKVAVDYQGRTLLPAEEHTVRREYSFDETELLAKQRESDILRQALADDLAALIMQRMAAL